MAPEKLTLGRVPNNATTYTTAAFTVAPNRLILIWVTNVRAGNAAIPSIPTASGTGLVLQQVSTVLIAGTQDRRLTCFRAVSPATALPALTLTFAFATQQNECAWSVFDYVNFDGTGANGAAAVAQAITGNGSGMSLTLMLGPLTDAANSVVVGGVMLRGNSAIVPGGGLAEIDSVNFGAAAPGSLETADRTGNGAQPAWSWTGTDDAAAIAIEIRVSEVIPTPGPPPDDPETLARQFEPIIFLHHDERFYPSDAKRYLEQCALWKAEAPFDLKADWGGIGLPFDRQPLIAKGKISGLASEPGMRIDSNSVQTAIEERFLELNGWLDKSRATVPGVTATSQNAISNRGGASALYNNREEEGGDVSLSESRFWYHAELLTNDRLVALLGTVDAPDLVKVLRTLKNAALLNYYFFFPGHDEPLAATCTNFEGTEFGGYSGEWKCFSVLLERSDPNGIFQPTFVGLTGRLLSVLPPATGQAVDTDDAARRTVMRVSPFSSVDMSLGHPALFAANGTHSLYTQAGSHATAYPDDSAPIGCGMFEGSEPDTDQPDSDAFSNPAEALGLTFAKIVAGGLLGGPWGAIAGFVAGIIEYAEADHGFDGVATGVFFDVPPPDETGDRDSTKAVKPAGLNLSQSSPDIHDWTSAQGLMINNRRYDFLVDRATQLWWPNDLGRGGYSGRWGPRVESDPFGRRAGQRMPTFWRMFFLAYADGKGRGAF